MPFLGDSLAVQGVDASEEMLAICRTKAARVGVIPTLYHQFMQDLDLAERYGTVFIPVCSFQILVEREEPFAALRRFHQHLEPGGELLITLTVPRRDFELERQWRLRRSGVRPSDGAAILINEAMVSHVLSKSSTSRCVMTLSRTGVWSRHNYGRADCDGTTATSLP